MGPNLKFTVPNQDTAGKAVRISFSLPFQFASNELTLSGLQIDKYAKQKKSAPSASSQAAKKSKSAAPPPSVPQPPPPPPPKNDYIPADGFEVLPKPPAVPIDAFIAHRFDTADWPRGWCEGFVQKVVDGKRHAGQYEVHYEGETIDLTRDTHPKPIPVLFV